MAHMAILVTTISGIVLFLSLHELVGQYIAAYPYVAAIIGVIGILYGRQIKNGFPGGH